MLVIYFLLRPDAHLLNENRAGARHALPWRVCPNTVTHEPEGVLGVLSAGFHTTRSAALHLSVPEVNVLHRLLAEMQLFVLISCFCSPAGLTLYHY